VEIYRNHVVYVPTSSLPPLDKDEFYHHQLIGLTVIDESGSPLGRIVEILETGANDVFVIRASNQADILLPYLESLVIAIDLERGEYHTRLIPGLLSDE
jgi:16S rRNA processing protein RimM